MLQSMRLQRVRHNLVTEQQQMFTVASFTTAKVWQLPTYSTMEEWIKNIWHICMAVCVCVCNLCVSVYTHIGNDIQP